MARIHVPGAGQIEIADGMHPHDIARQIAEIHGHDVARQVAQLYGWETEAAPIARGQVTPKPQRIKQALQGGRRQERRGKV
jgi:hypothetical protein